MSQTRIIDINAGKPDARDEIDDNPEGFFNNFILPPKFPIESFFTGNKYLVSGDKGSGKTSALYYFQDHLQKRDIHSCTSFIYFKGDFEEIRKSTFEAVAKKMTAYIDIRGDIQPDKVEYLHIWRWVFFRHIVDDCAENGNGLYEVNDTWYNFVDEVNKINFKSDDKRVISLSSLGLSMQVSTSGGVSASANATFDKESNNNSNFLEFVDTVDRCEQLFNKLTRTDIPYYIFVDEIEAFYGNSEMFKRDLTLIRDLIFTMHRFNKSGKVRIIGAIRNEVLFAIDRFIPTNELNKITDGYTAPIRWDYSNTNSVNHPIIGILMKRISLACNSPQRFEDWFPPKVNNKKTVSYILDNGWSKPRDIVRLILAAQNDSLHCNDTCFTQASFDSLRREYSKNSLKEIRQELQALYSISEIEMIFQPFKGGPRYIKPSDIRERTPERSPARMFWEEKQETILEDLYRVGFLGNVRRQQRRIITWRWNHKQNIGVFTDTGWELAIHPALYSEFSIRM